MNISDEAFAVWCGLRSIMEKDTVQYFVSYNRIACVLFDHAPNRYELSSVKRGIVELKEKGFIKTLYGCSNEDCMADLSALYFDGKEFFSDITLEEMHQIMNIDGKYDKYKLLRYFACQVGSFNRAVSQKSH